MSSNCPKSLASLASLATLLACLLSPSLNAAEPCCGPAESGEQAPRASPGVLRVAADPNNLPFSNQRLEGFENKIAALIAADLKMELQYVWRAQRRGFIRETLKAGEADLVIGVPKGFDPVLTTDAYYRSSYVFVSRKDRALPVRSFDDPLLRKLKVGVQLVGDDGANTPPAHVLAERGIIDNVVGFTVYGDYRQENPPARIVSAVAGGEVDVAVVWGPLAGYFARRENVPLALTIVDQLGESSVPMAFNIAMGVRKQDKVLRDQLNDALKRRHGEIRTILDQYGVPRVAMEAPKASPAGARGESDDKPR